ncbi:ACT domain-containing protein [Candidatus Albibeggiatoa sp. nov. BB20]|uniref:glycine cleavage system protein R n=1 Tax=Candidatus Albibeggiatoa sp. nov. BB20 TaxID=3162723 RepID=UPI0033657C60
MQQLMICGIADNQPQLLTQMSKAILDCGGHIVDSRATVFGHTLSLNLQVTGSWDVIVKIEDLLPRLQAQYNFNLISSRTEARQIVTDVMPYGIEVIALYDPKIIYELCEFFSSRNIGVEELISQRYVPNQTNTLMYTVSMMIYIPNDDSIPQLRNEFMEFCDDLNLDAVIAPTK